MRTNGRVPRNRAGSRTPPGPPGWSRNMAGITFRAFTPGETPGPKNVPGFKMQTLALLNFFTIVGR